MITTLKTCFKCGAEKPLSEFYKHPRKYFAHIAVGNALRDGVLMKQNFCQYCLAKDNIVAHHSDYAKPLDVIWLCQACHVAWHKQNGEGLNGG